MNKPLVLVVEDDTPVRNLITTTLKTHEYRYPKNPFVVEYADHCDQRQNGGF